MQKHKYMKMGLIACLAVLAASVQVRAMDMAAASGVLADIAVAATQANEALASAAGSGDPAAVQAAQEQVAAVAEAAQEAAAAYEALAAANGNDPAAEQALLNAQQKAAAAVGNEVPEQDSGGEANEGDDDGLPNPADVPWQSDMLREQYESLFNMVNTASAQGGAEFPENDATSI